jgi:hypothetical protein
MRKSQEILEAITDALSPSTPYGELERSRRRSVDMMVRLWAKGAAENIKYITDKTSQWNKTYASPLTVASEIINNTECPVSDKKTISGIEKIKESFILEASEFERQAEEDCIKQADELSSCIGKQFFVVETFDRYRTYDTVDESGLRKRRLSTSSDEVVYTSE